MSSVINLASKLGSGWATRRASLAAVVLAAAWLCLGATSALADSVIDTTAMHDQRPRRAVRNSEQL